MVERWEREEEGLGGFHEDAVEAREVKGHLLRQSMKSSASALLDSLGVTTSLDTEGLSRSSDLRLRVIINTLIINTQRTAFCVLQAADNPTLVGAAARLHH